MKASSMLCTAPKFRSAHEREAAAAVTAQDDLTVLTHEEKTALENLRKSVLAEHNEHKAMADRLIAIAGAAKVTELLPTTYRQYMSASNNGEQGLGIIVLDNLDSHTIRLICDRILELQHSGAVPAFASGQGGGDDEDESVQEADSSESSWNPASIIDMRINRSLMKNESDSLVYLSNTTAADARNSFVPGKIILCAATIEETRDTIGNAVKIDSNSLIEGIVDHVTDFMTVCSAQYGLPVYSCQKGPDPLKTVLSLLCKSSDISVNPYTLAIWACAVWKNMEGGKEIIDLRRAMGRSLNVFSLPSDSCLFTVSNLDKCTKTSYSRRLNEMLKSRSSLRTGNITTGRKTQQLKFKTVAENYLNNFVNDDEGNASLSSTEHAIIRNYLSALSHFEQESYSNAFALLCRIDWDTCLEALFQPKNKKADKKTLWEQTVDHFNAHRISEDENITDEEREEVAGLADQTAKSLSKEDQAVLYQFYRSHRRIIEKKSTLENKWRKLIFGTGTYSDSNFMLSLTSCILNLQLTQEQSIERIELTLDVSNDDMMAFNYEAASYFSMRFGPYLARLQRVLPGRFFVTGPGITLPEPQLASGAGSSAPSDQDSPVSPVINYEAFLRAHEASDDEADSRSQSTAAKALQLKFQVNITLSGTASKERYQITWSADKDNPLRFTHDLDAILNYGRLLAGSYEQRLYGLSSTEKLVMTLKSGSAFAGYQDGLALFRPDDSHNLSEEANRIFNRLKTEHASSYPGINDQVEKLREEWDNFTDRYFECLQSLRDSALLYDQALELSRCYAMLQGHIMALGYDKNADNNLRSAMRALSSVLLQTGMAWPVNHTGTAIASPFSVESMRGFTARMERLTSLIVRRVLNQTDVCEPDMFMDTLSADINYVDAPELCLADPAESTGSRYPLIACENYMGYTLYNELSRSGHDFSPLISAEHSITEIISFISTYISSQPYPPESFTIMVNECRFPDLATELYRKLLAAKGLSKMSFRILFVNRDMQLSQELYRTFERLRTTPEFVRLDLEHRINISVLAYIRDQNATGTLVNYLNSHTLSQDVMTQIYKDMANASGGNASAGNSTFVGSSDGHGASADGNSCADYCAETAADFTRIADVALLFHVFDGHSSVKMQSSRLPVLTDEINAQPSLINRNSSSDSSGTTASRYIINQMQTAERIVWFNSILFAEDQQSDAGRSAQTCQKLMAYIDSRSHDNATFESDLPFRYLSDVSEKGHNHQSLDDFINSVHERSEVVAFMDELQCRSIVEKDHRRLVYYSRLKHSDINFMVSSAAPRSHTDRWLTGIYDNLCSDRKDDCKTFIDAARRDASAISGSIVLRAESRRHNTMELTGNVMSRFLGAQIFARFQHEYGLQTVNSMPRPVFLSLDDYMSVLTVRKGMLADILGMQIFEYPQADAQSDGNADIAPDNDPDIALATSEQATNGMPRNRYVLAIQILESKFLQQFSRTDANKSARQARVSTEMLSEPFNGNHADRHQWLARLTGMITDNCRVATKADSAELAEIINIINEGHFDIHVSGLSLVFACNSDSKGSDTNDIASAAAIPDFSDKSGDGRRIIQLCLHRNAIKKMFDAYIDQQRSTHGSGNHGSDGATDCRVLDNLLARAEMSDLNQYLTRNGPQIISLNPQGTLDLTTSPWPQQPLSRQPQQPVAPEPEVKPEVQQQTQPQPQQPAASEVKTETPKQPQPAVTPAPEAKPEVQQQTKPQHPAAPAPEVKPEDTQQPRTPGAPVYEATQQEFPPVTHGPGTNPEAVPQGMPQVTHGPGTNPEATPQDMPQVTHGPATNPEAAKQLQGQAAASQDDETVVYAEPRSLPMITVPRRSYGSWRPVADNLSHSSDSAYDNEDDIRNNIDIINQAISGYKVKAHVVNHETGPVITRYDLELSSDTKSKRITELANDIARQLTVASIRVVPVVEGTPHVGLEVPNKKRISLHLGDLVHSNEFQNCRMELPVCFGVSVTGSPIMVDLADAPHLILAGTTGSGKSAGLNNMLLSLLLKRSPAQLRMLLIDPKQLELSLYRDLPHLLVPVITDDIEKNTIKALSWCVDEMERRFKLMSLVGVRKISEFNELVERRRNEGNPVKDPLWTASQSPEPQLLEPLPNILIVIEEFADLMAQSSKKKKDEVSVESLLGRLGQKSRAAGFNMILATQTPRVEVINGTIRSNFPSRIAFTVQSGTDSKVILNETGAENLLGKGDMLYKMSGSAVALRAHGSFVSNEDVHYVVNAWKERCGTAEYVDGLLDKNYAKPEIPLSSGMDQDYARAHAMVKNWQKENLYSPQVSDLQQSLGIDFSKANRIYNRLKENGVLRT